MADTEELQSSRAIVATRQINGENGGGTVFCVVLADGFILECGSDYYAQRRAVLLAKIINATGPEVQESFRFKDTTNG
jgi:hypothetical protein